MYACMPAAAPQPADQRLEKDRSCRRCRAARQYSDDLIDVSTGACARSAGAAAERVRAAEGR